MAVDDYSQSSRMHGMVLAMDGMDQMGKESTPPRQAFSLPASDERCDGCSLRGTSIEDGYMANDAQSCEQGRGDSYSSHSDTHPLFPSVDVDVNSTCAP